MKRTRFTVALVLSAVCALVRAARARAGLSQQAGDTSSCRSRRAAPPTSWRAPSARSSPRCGGSRSSSRIGRAPAAPSAPRSWPSRRPTATRCWCIRRHRRTTLRFIRRCPTTRRKDFVDVAPLGGQPNVLVVAPAPGVQDGVGADRAGEAEARHAQFRLGRQRQRHAHQRREIQARRRHRRRAHSVQGHAGGAHRHADGARHVFLLADLRRAAATCAKASWWHSA